MKTRSPRTALESGALIGYGDNHDPGGADGLSSQVVEYRMDGSIVYIYTVVGHNDGVKIDPVTDLVCALQNEDGNSNLVIIDPEAQSRKFFQLGTGMSRFVADLFGREPC